MDRTIAAAPGPDVLDVGWVASFEDGDPAGAGELSVLAVGRPVGARHRATALTNSQTYPRVIRLLAELADGRPAARGWRRPEHDWTERSST